MHPSGPLTTATSAAGCTVDWDTFSLRIRCGSMEREAAEEKERRVIERATIIAIESGTGGSLHNAPEGYSWRAASRLLEVKMSLPDRKTGGGANEKPACGGRTGVSSSGSNCQRGRAAIAARWPARRRQLRVDNMISIRSEARRRLPEGQKRRRAPQRLPSNSLPPCLPPPMSAMRCGPPQVMPPLQIQLRKRVVPKHLRLSDVPSKHIDTGMARLLLN